MKGRPTIRSFHLDLSYCVCANEDIRPSRMNPEPKSQLTIPKRLPRIASSGVRFAVPFKKPDISVRAFKSKSYGELPFDFATHVYSTRLACGPGDVIAATLHNLNTVTDDRGQSESASAVLRNTRAIALSAAMSRLRSLTQEIENQHGKRTNC
jgi:hypothetical protein